MRELKFRAWDNKRKEWYGKSNPQHSLTFYGFSIFGECTLLSSPDCDDLQNIEIEQYIGLNDKNGKEIYEGDIVFDHDRKCEREIVWLDEGCQFIAVDLTPEREWDILSIYDRFEIFGNIHEDEKTYNKKIGNKRKG
jgi:uncharacterized phage protein (TIGR01671 family)